jgi:hypothetical protein
MKPNKFGKYAIVDNIVHKFEKEPDFWWNIKPPTSGDELQISRFLVQARVEMGLDGTRREFPPTNTEIAHREIALTFGGTNLAAKEGERVEDGGAPIAAANASVEEIESVLRSMPHEMVMEIWGAIADAIPGWGPVRPKVKVNSSN